MSCTFRSGRTVYNWGESWGLNDNGEVSYGYDGHISYEGAEESGNRADEDNGLYPEDAIELASMMIERWTALKARYEAMNAKRCNE